MDNPQIISLNNWNINKSFIEFSNDLINIYLDNQKNKIYLYLSLNKHCGIFKKSNNMYYLKIYKNINKIKYNFDFYQKHVQLFQLIYYALYQKYLPSIRINLNIILNEKMAVFDDKDKQLSEIELSHNQPTDIIITPIITYKNNKLSLYWSVLQMIIYPKNNKYINNNKKDTDDGYEADADITEYE
jgi:hypothetical protein